MLTMRLSGREAAAFLYGYYAGIIRCESDRRFVTDVLIEAAKAAKDILDGGTFSGPVAELEMENMARRFLEEAAMKEEKRNARCSGRRVEPLPLHNLWTG